VDQVHPLRYHYRNGREICKLADRIAKDSADYEPLIPTSNYNEASNPSKVAIVQGNLDAQCHEIAIALRTQLRAYPNEFLAVVCARRADLNEIWDRLQNETDLVPKLCKIDDDEDAFDPARALTKRTF
jgi:hypothetical protein